LDDFDNLLIKVIDEVLRYALGDMNASIIYAYLEKKCCPLKEIPNNLEMFSTELRNLLGSGRGQILGSAPIIEKTILKALCIKLGLKASLENFANFVECVQKLRELYNNGKVMFVNQCLIANGGEKVAR